MRIAVIFAGSFNAAWAVSDGLVSTLRRMGHDVTELVRGRPLITPIKKELLDAQDLVIMSGPEHLLANKQLSPFNPQEIPIEQWQKLKAPVAFLYHESMVREDVSYKFAPLNPLAAHHFFPAIQDAEMYDQEAHAKGRAHWLPFSADTQVFRPAPCTECIGKKTVSTLGGIRKICPTCYGSGNGTSRQDIECGFIGLMYQKRIGFVNQLGHHYKPPPKMTIGEVSLIQDIDGPQWKETALRLAANYRRIQIFLNFPTLSQLLVTKVYEVMSSGSFLVTPELEGRAAENMRHFEHGKHLLYYKPSNLPLLWQNIKYYHKHPDERLAIAQAGMAEVHEKHSLESRLKDVLATMGVGIERLVEA